MNVSSVAIFVNARLVNEDGFFNRGNSIQRFILDLDEVHCVEGSIFVNCRHRGYRIANESYFVDAECMFILADGKNTVRNRQVFASDNCEHSWRAQRL